MKRLFTVAGAVILALALATLMLWLVGLIGSAAVPPGTRSAPAGPAAPDRRATAEALDLPVHYEAVGTVTAKHSATLAAQIPGEVLRVAVRAGDRVEEGAVLAELDSREYRARLAQAESGLAAAQAGLTRAEQAHARVARLRAGDAATEQQLEAAVAQRDQARARHAMAEQKVAEVEAMLDYTRISAPFAGLVAERLAEPGDLAWPGKPLLELYRPDAMQLEADVREGMIGSVAQGDEAAVVLHDGRHLSGTVDEIVPAADPVSRSFRIKVSLDASEGLFPGMFGRLRLPRGVRRAIVIPRAAVHRVGQLATVLAATADGWQRRYVTLGAPRADRVEVLSGLRAGETVGLEER